MKNPFSQLRRQGQFRAVTDRRGMTLVEVMVAIAIFALVFGSVMTGLWQANYRAFWISCDAEAGRLAELRMEQMQSAQWDITASPVIDQLTTNNFTNMTYVLLSYTNGVSPIVATNWVSISIVTNATYSAYPAYKVLSSSVAWTFEGRGPWTNTVTTLRALDQ